MWFLWKYDFLGKCVSWELWLCITDVCVFPYVPYGYVLAWIHIFELGKFWKFYEWQTSQEFKLSIFCIFTKVEFRNTDKNKDKFPYQKLQNSWKSDSKFSVYLHLIINIYYNYYISHLSEDMIVHLWY